MIIQKDSLEFLKSCDDFEFDLIYADPPYALGSEVIVRADGKLDYKKATDFMSKWSMPAGDYWNDWFKEANRLLKYSGRVILFGMDRQTLLFKYYAVLNGFIETQSLYWYFISNFPKSSDLSKNIDKHFGEEREIIGNKIDINGRIRAEENYSKSSKLFKGNSFNKSNSSLINYVNTIATSNLAKKYDGYKYSIAPMKQNCETIMIFQKPYKTGSCLHDTLAYENGDSECSCGAVNIQGNRCKIDSNDPNIRLNKKNHKHTINNSNVNFGTANLEYLNNRKFSELGAHNPSGRYPSQTFLDSDAAEILDKQSGFLHPAGNITEKLHICKNSNTYLKNNINFRKILENDNGGGCSKILHKCDYEEGEFDIFNYQPKVSPAERNAGCYGFKEKSIGNFEYRDKLYRTEENLKYKNPISDRLAGNGASFNNPHPTLKPIALNEKILKLFKTPNPQKICYPFAGVFSEVIGGYRAGFTDFKGCELNNEYIEIGKARFEYWKNKSKIKVYKPKQIENNNQLDLFK